MTALVNYIRDQRSAEKMKELLENAVKERTQEITVAAINAAAEKTAEAPKAEEEITIDVETLEKTENTEPAQTETESKPEETEKSENTPAPEEPKPRFCDQCGAKITSPNAKFCAECGNKLS